MKKILFMVATVALAMVSCNKEEINNGAQDQASDIVFVAEFGQEEQTKTALGDVVDGKRQATWVAGDEISINGTTFTAKADGATAEFTTAVAFDETAEVFRAVYPATSYKNNAVAIPATQNGTFANASIAVAESNNQSLKFSNVSSILKFQVPVACETVTFESSNSIAGNVTVTYENGVMTPNYGSLTNLSKKITVTAEGGFVAGTDYYVAVKPGAHQFTVSIDGAVSKASTKTVTVERSTILNMGELPEPVIRLYVKSEYTHFDMNVYAWGINGVSLPSTWPGSAMKWDKNRSLYYYDFPYGIKGKKLNYIVNNGVYQTADLNVTINGPEHIDNSNVNWHWLYFKPSNNWKGDNAWFAACFDPDGVSYWMRSVGTDTNGVYGFVQPSGKTKVEFTRMNPAKDELSWSNKWNSTAQQTIPTNGNNYFQCTEGWWDAHNGGWTKYTLPN